MCGIHTKKCLGSVSKYSMYAKMPVGLEKIYDQNGGKCNTRPTSDNTYYIYN
jgi:hypothetical protein